MEYVYPLNLPPMKEVFLETFEGFQDDDLITNYQFRRDIGQILKKEFCELNNIPWNALLYFKKDNQPGDIHTDVDIYQKQPNGLSNHPWGVNWVWEGDGLFEYWLYEDCDFDYVCSGSLNGNQGQVKVYNSNILPFKSYPMYRNKVYLTYGGLPHKATGYPGRKLLSLRCFAYSYRSWEKTVESFKDYIVT